MSRRYLLSIDSSGIRGIIPAVALVKLENTTRRPTREICSFVAGISIGAVMATAVAAGILATRILDLHTKQANEIFTHSPWNFIKRILSSSMYSNEFKTPRSFRDPGFSLDTSAILDGVKLFSL
jgi:patatin-like phospholipase/acyl hydrolase